MRSNKFVISTLSKCVENNNQESFVYCTNRDIQLQRLRPLKAITDCYPVLRELFKNVDCNNLNYKQVGGFGKPANKQVYFKGDS